RGGGGEEVISPRPIGALRPDKTRLEIKERLVGFDSKFPDAFPAIAALRLQVAGPIIVGAQNDFCPVNGIDHPDDLEHGGVFHWPRVIRLARNSRATSFRSTVVAPTVRSVRSRPKGIISLGHCLRLEMIKHLRRK